MTRKSLRQQYFRAWQLAWAAYSLHYILDAFPDSSVAFFVSELFLVAMALCIFVSTRMMRGPSQFRWYDAAVGAVGVVLALLTLHGHIMNGAFRPDVQPSTRLGLGLAMILGIASNAMAQSLYELYDAARAFDAPYLAARAAADSAYANMSSGMRWAETTRASKGTPNSARISVAARKVSQSLLDPI